MRCKLKLLFIALLTGLCGAVSASAQVNSLYLEDFRTNQTLRFAFGSFEAPSAISFSSEGVSTNIPASGDSFGGLGVNPIEESVDITGTTSIEVVARANAGNQSTVSIDPVAFNFNGDRTDGILNGVLSDTGIQSPFNGTAAQNYTIQSIQYVGPPQGPVPPAPGPGPADGCLSPVAIHGPLSVSGVNIVDQNNEIVSFAGNAFFWSNTGFGAEGFYNSDVVDWLQEDWHATIVRASMGVDEFGGFVCVPDPNNPNNPRGLNTCDPQGNMDRVIRVVDAAIANDMYVIIDWHSHHAEDFRADAVQFFTEMAQRYGDSPHVIYEIYNEPITRDWSGTIKPYSEAVIEAIRAVDPDNLIIVGTGFFSQEVDVASQDPITGFDNIAYTLHFYAGTHGQSLRDRGTTAINNGLALMVTEWGTVNADGDGPVDRASTEEWLEFMALHNLTHLNWSVHDVVEGASILRPGASRQGGWPDFDLTESGLFVRQIIRDHFTCVEDMPEVDPFLLGDCNQDGVVNFSDIPVFIAILQAGDFLEEADCNLDGVVNFSDIPSFISILSAS